MFKILEANELTTNIFQMIVEAPRVASACLPGQFLIIRVHEDGERIPLTICDYNREKGTVEIVAQAIGAERFKLRKPAVDVIRAYLDTRREVAIADALPGADTAPLSGLAQKVPWTYVGGHPMAGKERSGYENATADLFKGASMIFTP